MTDQSSGGAGVVADGSAAAGGASSAATPSASAGSGPSGRRRAAASGGSDYSVIPGVRKVKGYPVTRDELLGLGASSVAATFCFSVGGGLITRSQDIRKDIELAQGVPERVVGKYQAKSEDAFFYGCIFIAFGVLAAIFGGLKVLSVIWSTNHPK